MTSKDLFEIKRTFKPENCTITKMEGMIVSSDRNEIGRISSQLLTLDEEVVDRWLKLIREIFSGVIDDNIMSVKVENEDQLSALIDSDLSEFSANQFLEHFRFSYENASRYVVVLFKAAYDVPARSADGKKLEDGTEVFQHIVGIVCPIKQTKAGLGFLNGEIGLRFRDWVLGKPEAGFMYPDFQYRHDGDRIMLYYSTPESPKDSLARLLECEKHRTMSQIRGIFENIIKEAAGEDWLMLINACMMMHICRH